MTEQEFRELELTRDQVDYQLREHGIILLDEFYNEHGDRSYYSGEDVLNWLGY